MFKALWFHQTCNSSQYFLRPLRSAFGNHVFLSDGKRRHCWSLLTVEILYSACKMPVHFSWYLILSLLNSDAPILHFPHSTQILQNLCLCQNSCLFLLRSAFSSPVNSFEHKLWLKKSSCLTSFHSVLCVFVFFSPLQSTALLFNLYF